MVDWPVCCPICHTGLTEDFDYVVCREGHRFKSVGGMIDFLPGADAQDAAWSSCIHADTEEHGMEHRLRNFIVPRIRETMGGGLLKVLDDGCGVGATVDLLAGMNFDAWGIDPGTRRSSWTTGATSNRKVIGDGCHLPFETASFDVVLSSGVLEHVGEPRPLDERDVYQRQYIAEIVRVLKPGGIAIVAHPNGAHPIDYWHPMRFSLRFHLPYEKWMPTASRVRRWVSDAPDNATVEFLSPENYLAFDRVRAHFYGRVLSGAMKAQFRLLSAFPALSTSMLNPWLIAEIRHQGDGTLAT